MRHLWLVLAMWSATACGGGEGEDAGPIGDAGSIGDAGPAVDAGGMDAGTDAGASDAGPPDARPPSDAGPRTLVPICYPACTTPADCDGGVSGYRAANFTCDDGFCIHRGCLDDDDCPTGGAYLCHSFAGEAPACVRVCFGVAECVMGGASPSMDADNYECLEGLCRWTGCNLDVECRNSFGPEWVCRPGVVPVTGRTTDVPICAPSCTMASDCVIGTSAFLDEDNFACVDGVCQYTGCNADVECAELSSAVCR